MNIQEFKKKVFELVWGPGADVEHYRNGLQSLHPRDNYYTYEETLDRIKKSMDLLDSVKKYQSVYQMNYD